MQNVFFSFQINIPAISLVFARLNLLKPHTLAGVYIKCIGRLVNTQQGFYFDFFSDVDQTAGISPMFAESTV